MKKKLLLILLTFYFSLFTFYVHSYAVNTGASFLRIGVSAKAMSMGNASCGLTNDISALYYNPAGLSNIENKQVGFSHSQWLAGSYVDFAGFAANIKNNAVLGLGVTYLGQDELEGRDENRQLTKPFSASDFAVSFAYSEKLNQFSRGITVKSIRQNIEEHNASGFALDMGGQYYTPIKNLKAGLAIKNLGPDMKFISESYKLPLTISMGFGYSISGVNLAFDVNQLVNEGRTDICLGTEYIPVNSLSLRLGYNKALFESISSGFRDLDEQGISSGIGAGVGINFLNSYSMDYSFLPYGELGNTHRMSIITKFQ